MTVDEQVPESPVWQPPAPEDRRPGNLVGWNLLLGFDLGIIGLLLLGSLAISLVGLPAESPDTDPEAARGALWANVIVSLLIFAVIPLVWLLGTRVRPVAGALAYLKLRQPVRSFALGVGLTGYPLAAVIVLSVALGMAGYTPDTEGNPLEAVDWPLAVAISLGAGIGEEILFRGILMPWIGLWGQAILFGLAHAPNGLVGVGFTFAFGLWAGWLVRRGWSLWALMTAHALYDLVLLSWSILEGS